MRTIMYYGAILIVFLLTGPVFAKSDEKYLSPSIVAERQRYIARAIKELRRQMEILEEIIKHEESMVKLFLELPIESLNTIRERTHIVSEAKEKVQAGLAMVDRAQREMKRREVEKAEKELNGALEHISKARELLLRGNYQCCMSTAKSKPAR